MKHPESSARITGHLESALARALSSMTGQEFTIRAEPKQDPLTLEGPIVWRQAFSFDPEPMLWIVAGKDLWTMAGEMTLGAVGIDSLTEEDSRSTWQEIVGQTIGAFATGLTSDVQREITAAKGEEADAEPGDVQWTVFSARHDEKDVWYVKAGWLPALNGLYERPSPEQKSAAASAGAAGGSTFSKTFDLLLDVALPVSVSFGKTSLQIREVLKLNTGSIVELNRLVIEPVDVIVNDCVIARGEVVVVDGNYGVRVTQLASREERLRFGIAETSTRVSAAAGTGGTS